MRLITKTFKWVSNLSCAFTVPYRYETFINYRNSSFTFYSSSLQADKQILLLFTIQIMNCFNGITSWIISPEIPTEGIKMWKLPGVQNSCQHQSTSIKSSSTGSPAHQGRQGTHYWPHPCVQDAESLHRGVDGCIKKQCGCTWNAMSWFNNLSLHCTCMTGS